MLTIDTEHCYTDFYFTEFIRYKLLLSML